jgi:signal transduction histidine kinase
MNGSVKVRVELVGAPHSARDARRLITRTLQEWSLGHLEEYAALLVSEVVTNAVMHARTDLAVELERRADVVRVTVSDGSPRQPHRRRHGLSAGTGRGLALVATLASDWGSAAGADPWQKDVWFELPLDASRLADPGEAALDRS